MSHLEIEKRYLCNSKAIINMLKHEKINYIIINIEQFYLKATKEETLRFRKEDNRYIKNIKRGSGLVREEIEEEISKKEYKKAKVKKSGGVIKKSRYKFKIDNQFYELDVFKGKLKGLNILEVEFNNIYEANNFKINPKLNHAIIKDITNEAIYSNGALSLSMKIPLRKDSILSFKELSIHELKKPKFDLYISDYEGAHYAFTNSSNRLLNSFVINIEQFLNNCNYKELKRANKALIRLKSLIIGHKKYIKKSSYIKILFNINTILLLFEEAINLQKEFLYKLKNKKNLTIDKQIKASKELLNIARQEKIYRKRIKQKYNNILLLNLKESLDNIEFKDKIKKPFYFIRDKTLKYRTKKLKKELQNFTIKELYLNLLYFNNLKRYFKRDPLKQELAELKKMLLNNNNNLNEFINILKKALNAN